MSACCAAFIPRWMERGCRQVKNIFVSLQTFPSTFQAELLPRFTDEAAEHQELVHPWSPINKQYLTLVFWTFLGSSLT